jgi:Family of unknown function (DUF6152)
MSKPLSSFLFSEFLGGIAMRTKFRALVAGVSLLCLAAPVLAHHGFDTEYDRSKKVSLTGVVSKLEWTNPHAHLYIDVSENGKVTTWNLELTSPNVLRRRGWSPKDIAVGDKVVFEAFGGKVVMEIGNLGRLAKAATPDKVIFFGEAPAK